MSRKRKRTPPLPVPRPQAAAKLEPSNIEKAIDVLPGAMPIGKRIEQITKQTTFSGPIPHPEIFRQYGEVIPDAPERILRVFEEDSRHVRDISMAALNAQKGDNHRSHWMAFTLIFTGLLLTGFLAYIGKDWLAAVIAGTTLAGTIAGFFGGKKAEK